jgi:hypothetical protein
MRLTLFPDNISPDDEWCVEISTASAARRGRRTGTLWLSGTLDSQIKYQFKRLYSPPSTPPHAQANAIPDTLKNSSTAPPRRPSSPSASRTGAYDFAARRPAAWAFGRETSR